jgi:hypothetical protein
MRENSLGTSNRAAVGRIVKASGLVLLVVAGALSWTSRHTTAQQTDDPLAAILSVDDSALTEEDDFFGVKGLDLRSHGRQMADTVRRSVQAGQLTLGTTSNSAGLSSENRREDGDHGPDNVQTFPGTRPFEESTQSETSVASVGRDVVVGYNSSAGEPIVRIGTGLFATHIFLSGFSTSHDGGRTWASGFVPPPVGSLLTFGDPSVGVDRRGNFYYAGLGGDAVGNSVIMVNKSTTRGSSWGPGVIAATDNGADKDWLAIGPDPFTPGRDNLYVTWTRFSATGSEAMLSRSIDGGATWTTKSIFKPVGTAILSSQIQFTNPVVDQSNGRLYVPLLHFTNIDADLVRVLVSDDGGGTFHFLAFNAPGAVDAFGYPVVTPGEFTDCGANNGGLRNVLHQGPNLGGGRFGLARYRFATRLITQPATAVFRGRLFIAINASTSPIFGDPSSGSEIRLLASFDGGSHWAPALTVARSTARDPQHVHPAIALKDEGHGVTVGYYVQQHDTRLRTDVASISVDDGRLEVEERRHLSDATFDLTPSNNPLPIAGNPFFTTNYDRTIRACYNIGEYMSIQAARGGDDDGEEGGTIGAWGDNRRTWIGPPTSIFPGPHAQADVFFSGRARRNDSETDR